MFNCRSHGAPSVHFRLQSSHLSSCDYHQDLHWELIHWALHHKLHRPSCHSLHPESAREKRAAFCASEGITTNVTKAFFWCCGRFHSRTTLSDCRYQGRTPPSAGARTPCPEAKARAGSNTRHGLPHSTCTLLFSCSSGQSFRQGASTSVLAQGHTSGAGATPTRPLLRGPGVS